MATEQLPDFDLVQRCHLGLAAELKKCRNIPAFDQSAAIFQELRHLNQAVTSLGEEVTSLKQEVAGLREDVTSLRQEVTSLRQEAAGLGEEVTSLRQEVAGLGEVTSLRQDISTIHIRIAIPTTWQDSQIACLSPLMPLFNPWSVSIPTSQLKDSQQRHKKS
ncbi:hypothetical protein BGZ60DRAFT_264493 [Tricladium varicosporioides]|nr:hypothetical protein BGZ60DRAFT_264493 [Hymenoscyphus varicosporioides]